VRHPEHRSDELEPDYETVCNGDGEHNPVVGVDGRRGFGAVGDFEYEWREYEREIRIIESLINVKTMPRAMSGLHEIVRYASRTESKGPCGASVAGGFSTATVS
jgi:hypothetical protein